MWGRGNKISKKAPYCSNNEKKVEKHWSTLKKPRVIA